jgi:parvulin-like peptidyl-prolyl isomerase
MNRTIERKKMRYSVILTTVWVMMLSISVFAETTETKDASKETKAFDKASYEKTDEVVLVTVNGHHITEAEVLQELKESLEGPIQDVPPGVEVEEIAESEKYRRRLAIIDRRVGQILMDEETKKQNIEVTDEEVKKEIQKMADQKGESLADLEKKMLMWGVTMDNFKRQVRYQIQLKKLCIKMEGDVSEEEIRTFYDEHPAMFKGQEGQVRVRHILCGNPNPSATGDELLAELKKIEDVQKRLKAGEKFENLVKEVSVCPSRSQGGDLGFLGKGQTDPAFEKAIYELKVGETSGIVKTQSGYHIIQRLGEITFEEAKETIKKQLFTKKFGLFWEIYQEKMKETAKIEFSPQELAFQEEMDKKMDRENL